MNLPIYAYYIIAMVVLVPLGMGVSLYFHRKNGDRFLQENPDASKMFMDTGTNGITSKDMRVLDIDGEPAVYFYQTTKSGVYIKPGKRIVNVTYSATRPGILHKSVTNIYGPQKIELDIQPNKEYKLKFNKKEENFEIIELN